ncbi:MAG: Gfo/Idh/MocA family protein [Beutenbergiaceae bacterium]
MAARVLRVGLVGVGWMGRLHSKAYSLLPFHYPDLGVEVRLVHAADPLAEHQRQATQELGYDRTGTDADAVFADPQVDVVSICSPNFLHRQHALGAAAAGKPFWIEKPMGRGLAESEQIAQAAQAAQLVTAVGFSYRNVPLLEHLRTAIGEGRLGRITNVNVEFMADYSADPRGARTWRFERDKAGSGVLGDLMSHAADLAEYLVGPIASVTGLTQTVVTERPAPVAGASHFATGDGPSALLPVENEDHAAFLAQFSGGAVGIMEASRVALGRRADYRVRVAGTHGSAQWTFSRMNELTWTAATEAGLGGTRIEAGPSHGEFSRFQPGAGISMGFDDLKTIEAARFVTSVLTGRQHGASVEDGVRAAGIVQAVERSAEQQAWLPTPQ